MSTTPSTPFPLGVMVGNANADDPSAEAAFDADVKAFSSLMGATPVVMNEYIDQTQTPSQWASNVGWSAGSAEASPSWKGVIPSIALPMGSTNPDAPSAMQILQNYANGTYDSMLQGMVQSYANDGFKTQYWRPGVEMNLSSTPGFVGSSASMQAEWIAAFQHIYTTLHAAAAADGVNLKVIWNPGVDNGSAVGNATQTLWPGSQYVDVVGVDTYGDIYPYGNVNDMYDWDKSGQMLNSPNPVYDTSLQQWASDPVNLEHYYTYPSSDQYTLDGSGGSGLSLQQIIDFAKAQGKPIAICETGAGNSNGAVGVTDNPTFVQWLSSTLESSGVTVDFVSIWDTNGGGTYEFSNASDDKPLEAAAWAKYFGAQSTSVAATPITITPATEAVKDTGTAGVKPFTGVAITDGNSGQTETAIVTLSSAANGTLSDPNAATDGSTSAPGILSVSGSAAAVATALDGLVFTPSHSTSTVTTTVTAAITDTAGKTASATSTITAAPTGTTHAASPADTQVNGTAGTIYDTSGNAWTITSGQLIAMNGTPVPVSADVVTLFWTGKALDQLNTSGDWWTQPLTGAEGTKLSGPPAGYVAPGSTVDTLALHVSEDFWKTDAQFTVSVDGKQVGGDYTASTLHSSGDSGTVQLTGDWGSGVNDVQVSFINDAYGGSSATDRNLYVNSASYNGVTYAGTSASLYSDGTASFAVGGSTATEAAPADTLTVNLSEEAWEGNAEFVLYIDGKAVTTPQAVTALHDAKATQSFSFTGNLGAGTHTLGVAFVNDAYGGSSSEDRNLYINGVTLNGSSVFSGFKAENSNGTSAFTLTTTH